MSAMIVRNLEQIKASGGYQEKKGVWSSARYLLRDDAVGFTLTQTTCAAGQSIELHYKNHVEANLVIEGEADLTDMETEVVYRLVPGSMYTLDKHDRHRLDVLSELTLVCVFTPALTGAETHDNDGSYPIL